MGDVSDIQKAVIGFDSLMARAHESNKLLREWLYGERDAGYIQYLKNAHAIALDHCEPRTCKAIINLNF